jgi:small subunit ribosomal protein S19
MARSLRKGPFVDPAVLHLEANASVWSRRSMILPHHVGQTFHVHTGKTFLSLLIHEDMVGHKFGEFASTRKKAIHKKKTKKK